MSSGFRETEEWHKGHNGEKLVAEYLQRHGWYVIPSYDYVGEEQEKAPRMQGVLRAYVIPDLDVANEGKRVWAEVKTKAGATWTRITQRYEHGIPLRHYRDYLAVQRITGTPVWLVIYEEDTRALLCGELDTLSQHKRIYEGKKMSRGGMVFFPRDQFALLATIEDDEQTAVAA